MRNTNSLSCSVVQDLLPQYVEKLLSEESEQAVREHLEHCEACRQAWQEMAGPEPEPVAEVREVDYLKKVRKSRKHLLAGALAVVAALSLGFFFYFRQTSKTRPAPAAAASVTYDERSKTVVIFGNGESTDVELPDELDEATFLDAQFSNYHLSVYLPALRTDGRELRDYLPGFLQRTDDSLRFLRTYLQEHCAGQYPAERAEKYVDITVLRVERYSWTEQEDRIRLETGSYYWHREELFLLALMGNPQVEWKQLGYAWYLGVCVDPYSEVLYTTDMRLMAAQPYYEAYCRLGGTEAVTPENYRRFFDAVSWYCLTAGMGWGSSYESMPLKNTGLYSGSPSSTDPGNEMSVVMATSFIGWLSDQYGFQAVSAFCFDQADFETAFGTDYDSAYAAWTAWILNTCGAD